MIEIKLNKSFNLDDTVTCGQIFRYEKEEDGSYTIILEDRVVNVLEKDNKLKIESSDYNNLEQLIIKYFDLERDYTNIDNIIVDKDKNMKEIVNFCNGFKMINSYPFETIISYIISANNSVSSIKKSVNSISKSYGKKVIFNDKEYYLFPTYKELKNVTKEEYRKHSVGFRDKYIESFVKFVNDSPNYLIEITKANGQDAYEQLQKHPGIGPKVASCILLFAYQKFDVFPIDTWVKKIMKETYNIEGEKNIREFTKKLYGEYSAIAIQYMFHYRRNYLQK